MKLFLFTISVSVIVGIEALDNGLALTPPMGWISWGRFRENEDCQNYPDECISEKLIKDMTDLIADKGYGYAGYEYVILDKGWYNGRNSSANNTLQPDPERFPEGIKALVDYVHDKGLKFGIGLDLESNYLELDAYTLAEWGVDYIKADSPNVPEEMDYQKLYTTFGEYIKKTERPMVYSCLWPVREQLQGNQTDYSSVSKVCNTWRHLYYHLDSWKELVKTLDYYVKHQNTLAPYAGPGHWNDPDMLMIGNYGLSLDQCKVQMALWAILSAPLLMSVDLRTIRPEFQAILQNSHVIEINQDPLGMQGKKVQTVDKVDIYLKHILPISENEGSYAIALFDRLNLGIRRPKLMNVKLSEYGLNHLGGYIVQNVFDLSLPKHRMPNETFKVEINPTGVVLLTAKIAVF